MEEYKNFKQRLQAKAEGKENFWLFGVTIEDIETKVQDFLLYHTILETRHATVVSDGTEEGTYLEGDEQDVQAFEEVLRKKPYVELGMWSGRQQADYKTALGVYIAIISMNTGRTTVKGMSKKLKRHVDALSRGCSMSRMKGINLEGLPSHEMNAWVEGRKTTIEFYRQTRPPYSKHEVGTTQREMHDKKLEKILLEHNKKYGKRARKARNAEKVRIIKTYMQPKELLGDLRMMKEVYLTHTSKKIKSILSEVSVNKNPWVYEMDIITNYPNYEKQSVTVISDGTEEGLKIINASPEDENMIRRALELRATISPARSDLHRAQTITASYDDPVGILAAICFIKPQKTIEWKKLPAKAQSVIDGIVERRCIPSVVKEPTKREMTVPSFMLPLVLLFVKIRYRKYLKTTK